MTRWTDYQDDISDAISDSMDMDWNANDGARAVVRWLNENKPLSAAPAPEGGAVSIWSDARSLFVRYAELFSMTERYEEASAIADKAAREIEALATREEVPAEWFGVTGAVDETEALAVALFAVRCPGVRMTDEDLHHYRSAAKRAMQVVSAELSGNPGQLDAPAEAGELEWKVDYNAVVAVSAHLQKQGLLDSAKAVERMLSRAAAYRNCRDAHDELAALRAQPPAREDAQPVAWAIFWRNATTLHPTLEAAETARKGVPHDIVPLYTHPAPDALRVAVEALEPFARAAGTLDGLWSEDDWRWNDSVRCGVTVRDIRRARQAIAALQAEQKGGA